MVLEHAPVTGLLLGISLLSSTVTPRHYMMMQTPHAMSGWKSTIRRLPLGSLPFGSLGVSLTDMFCSVVLLFQMRALERRWGSSPFLSFTLTAVIAGSILLNVLVTESTPPLSVEQLRILSAGGSIVPLASLVARLLMEIPSLHRWRVPATSVVLTEKLFVILPLLRLVLFPDTEIHARTHKRHAIHVDIGSWSRIFLALSGIMLGVASRKTKLVLWWLGFSSRYICQPFLNFMQPALSTLFGSTGTVELSIPQQFTGGYNPTGGRYTVENLSGLQENGNQQLHRPQFLEGSVNSGSLFHRRANQNEQRGFDGPNHASAVMNERIAQIAELGLGFDVEAIRGALISTGGQVDAAVEILVSQ